MDQKKGVCAEELSPPIRDPASFRDPAGFVCRLDDQVFRAVNRSCAALVRRLEESGKLRLLEQDGRLIPTRTVSPADPGFQRLHRNIPGVADFLQHAAVPFLSYPYEWPVSMLADAATCCLDLQLLLMDHGCSLKDASAYNVQFLNGRPVFIDVASLEQVPRRDVWNALDQFCRMFLYPLLLNRYGRCSIPEYFLAHLDGADLAEVYRRFGYAAAAHPALWLDLWLPYHLQRTAARRTNRLRQGLDQRHDDPAPLALNLRRLRRKIQALASRAVNPSLWLEYDGRDSYAAEELQRKETFVGDFLDEHPPRRVLDLGCNTGRFAELAARSAQLVVAVDSDDACVDALYRRLRGADGPILPLVMNIASPSPGLGFCNRERRSFLDRGPFDCVLALALVHHLLVTHRLPLESIRDLLADLTSAVAIVEFVSPADPLFARLLGARDDLYAGLSLSTFLAVFGERFRIIRQAPVTPHRSLLALQKRN